MQFDFFSTDYATSRARFLRALETAGGTHLASHENSCKGPAGEALFTDIARVGVTVGAVNDAPVIGAIPLLRGVEDQPFSAVLPSGLVSDLPSEGDFTGSARLSRSFPSLCRAW